MLIAAAVADGCAGAATFLLQRRCHAALCCGTAASTDNNAIPRRMGTGAVAPQQRHGLQHETQNDEELPHRSHMIVPIETTRRI